MKKLRILGTLLGLIDELGEAKQVARRTVSQLTSSKIVTQYEETLCLGSLSPEEIGLLSQSLLENTEVVMFLQDEVIWQVFCLEDYADYLCGYLNAQASFLIYPQEKVRARL